MRGMGKATIIGALGALTLAGCYEGMAQPGDSEERGLIIQGIQLQGVFLQGIQLQGTKLQGMRLQGISLQGHGHAAGPTASA